MKALVITLGFALLAVLIVEVWRRLWSDLDELPDTDDDIDWLREWGSYEP